MCTHIIYTHDGPVIDPVWDLYRLAHERTGGVSTLLEWDAAIPPFDVVHAEVLKARGHMTAAFSPQPLKNDTAAGPAGPSIDGAAVPHPLHHAVAEVA